MSRRHAPVRRWHVGDRVSFPYEHRIPAGDSFRTVTRWGVGEVVAVRGDRVVVRYIRWEREWPGWALRRPWRHRGNAWQRKRHGGHDRHRRTVA